MQLLRAEGLVPSPMLRTEEYLYRDLELENVSSGEVVDELREQLHTAEDEVTNNNEDWEVSDVGLRDEIEEIRAEHEALRTAARRVLEEGATDECVAGLEPVGQGESDQGFGSTHQVNGVAGLMSSMAQMVNQLAEL